MGPCKHYPEAISGSAQATQDPRLSAIPLGEIQFWPRYAPIESLAPGNLEMPGIRSPLFLLEKITFVTNSIPELSIIRRGFFEVKIQISVCVFNFMLNYIPGLLLSKFNYTVC